MNRRRRAHICVATEAGEVAELGALGKTDHWHVTRCLALAAGMSIMSRQYILGSVLVRTRKGPIQSGESSKLYLEGRGVCSVSSST